MGGGGEVAGWAWRLRRTALDEDPEVLDEDLAVLKEDLEVLVRS